MQNQLGSAYAFFKKYVSRRALKFIVSGGLVAGMELLVLYVCTDVFHVWYLFSLIIAFVIAFCLSFTLQKFWTFQNKGTEQIHFQAASYFVVALLNLGLNVTLLYIFVQFFGVWYLLAQVFISASIAIWSFLVYKFLIFKKPKDLL